MADRRVAGQLRSLTGQQVPGAAIAVAGPEGLREVAVAGYADLMARVAASADMVCPWFSMTKIVTATLAMRLADRGLLDLDRPVLPLVPELEAMKTRVDFRRCEMAVRRLNRMQDDQGWASCFWRAVQLTSAAGGVGQMTLRA
jgi:CubicO group peptidase (beta-lactamase class C family)